MDSVLEDLKKEDRLDRQYEAAYSRHPSCADPNHPGCAECGEYWGEFEYRKEVE